jgi:hypothetical protein
MLRFSIRETAWLAGGCFAGFQVAIDSLMALSPNHPCSFHNFEGGPDNQRYWQ